MPTLDGVEFNIHVIGDTTGQTWSGVFRAKERLSFEDQITIDKIRRDLLGPNPQGADSEILTQVQVLSELSVRLTQAPNWWSDAKSGLKLHDANVVAKIWEEALIIQKAAIDKIQKEGEEAQKALRDIKKTE